MIKEESLKDIQSMKRKTTHTLSAIEHNKSFQDIKDMSLNLGIEIEAKLRNVLYLLQNIEDDKAKKAFKIIDDLIY